MAMTGPSASTMSMLSGTMVAITMMTSLSGSRPVISRSIQIRFCGFCMGSSLKGGAQSSSRSATRSAIGAIDQQPRVAPVIKRHDFVGLDVWHCKTVADQQRVGAHFGAGLVPYSRHG